MLYDINRAAQKVGVDHTTVRNWIKRSGLKVTVIGKQYYIAEDDFNNFLRTYMGGKYLCKERILYHDDKETIDKCLSCEVPNGCWPESPLCKVNHGKRKAG